MTQSSLAKALGITFQQVQKYENGSNRVGASRLKAIASILQLPVSSFFGETADNHLDNVNDEYPEIISFLSTKEGFALNRAFARIEKESVRQTVLLLVDKLSKELAN